MSARLFRARLLAPAYSLLCLLLGFFLAWKLLLGVDFLYPLWYETLDIGTTIRHYAPQNRHGRTDFARTDRQEHRRLFGQIVKAIDSQGQGLEQITYITVEGRLPKRLLRNPEILHLKDVARVVTYVDRLGYVLLALWLLATLLIAYLCRPFRLVRASAILLGTIVVSGTVIWLTDPKALFYRAHTWIFPEKHPWFFYYQDSLMTTLMKAPQIFGVIALVLAVTGTLIWLALLGVARIAGKRRSDS